MQTDRKVFNIDNRYKCDWIKYEICKHRSYEYLSTNMKTKEELIENAKKVWGNLPEEQKKFFIDIWENNRNDAARVILCDKLGLPVYTIDGISKQLREEGIIRNKKLGRLYESDILKYKQEYECGKPLNEIAREYHVGINGLRKYLKKLYEGKIPRIRGKLDGEEWKDIEGFSRYQISNKGRVYNKIIHRVKCGTIVHNYRYVKLLDESEKYHNYAIHRLVAQAFIPNPENKPQVDHIDSNPLNNNVENLRWVNSEEQYINEETKKKKALARERTQKTWKLNPLIKSLLEIEPDKLLLIKLIIEYNS